jgi:mono/diheme cytochrome c family protein
MKTGRMLVVAVAALGLAGWSLSASADAAAGKAKFASACAECHEVGDFQGEDVKGLTESIKKIVAGQAKHKTPLKLTDQEISNVAAYMASGGK